MRQGGTEFFSEKAHYERYQNIKIDVEMKLIIDNAKGSRSTSKQQPQQNQHPPFLYIYYWNSPMFIHGFSKRTQARI